ncbi:N-acetylneuraminic acid mutarotase [Psittacicella hinzii]|uniref:N-acetylneuraminic acid mutarotase n=1 Tax=Psittacicella hinzii TaxID=2028575 RepID=A0A3A1Y7M2_9GAMM|nr:N-acetylneuraminate epimerase [Psittacicella hinzii]RIY34293.1 N-acetylneuraminic acid mutarotase [Psittacicella hinzii]
MKLALKTSLVLGLATAASSAFANVYPNLPVAIKQGGGALINDTVYIGLGSAGDKFFALDLKNAASGWKEVATFPGGSLSQPVVAAVNGKLYVLGGVGTVNGLTTSTNDVYEYDPAKNSWQKLPTRSPLGLVGASGFVHGDSIYIVGGTNLEIFNGFFKDNAAAKTDAEKSGVLNHYFDKRTQDYFFNTILFSYKPATNQWFNNGNMELKGRAGAGVAIRDNKFIVVNGEVKPGLRTDKVNEGKFNSKGEVSWEELKDLPPNPGEKVQDGVAGAYTGYIDKYLFVAGGANFPGADAAYKAGNLYAHKGLAKIYQKASFVYYDGKWSYAGDLPQGSGYGVAISYGKDLLLFGGETDGGKPLDQVYVVSYDPETKKVTFK